jgi:hypothetical protein
VTRFRVRRLAAGLLALALLVGPAGCGGSNGPSDYDKLQQEKQTASTTLAAAGAKVTEKQYSLGRAFVVELVGVTITDDLLRQVKNLGNIAELNLSKSTVTDDHLRAMHAMDLHALLTKLDLSFTAVTNAGLDHLAGNLFLAELNLTGTSVTKEGVDKFMRDRQADPKVRVKGTRVVR